MKACPLRNACLTGGRCENAAAERGLSGRDRGDALSVISKIVLHTGTGIDELTPADVLEMFAWSVHAGPPRRQVPGLHAAWDLLGDIGVIERHHPGIGTLHLPDEIAQAWKERARVITDADGTIRERKNIHALLMRVRALYLDIQQWALEDPS
jgi:hypothetical protein